jgi:hypothetical protein
MNYEEMKEKEKSRKRFSNLSPEQKKQYMKWY